MKNQKLTIITVNFNNASGLKSTIESLKIQTDKRFEYIVIDGASTDNSIAIINENLSIIDKWISEPDEGIYDAMNKGINMATGIYCLFLNTDDILANPNVIKQFNDLDLVEDIVSGSAYVRLSNTKKILVNPPDFLRFYDFYKHSLLHQATLIKKDLFNKYGLYKTKYKIIADWEFFIRVLFSHHCSYKSIQEIISVFDTTGVSSLPENKTICLNDRKEILEKEFPGFLLDYSLMEERHIYEFLKNLKKRKLLSKFITPFLKIINLICRN